MGAYQYGDAQPVLDGKRRPIPEPGGPICKCVAVQASPSFLRPLVRRLLPDTTITVTEQSLHPEVNRISTSLLSLQDTTSEYRTRVGIVLRISFTGVERRGDDLQSKLNVAIDNREVAFVLDLERRSHAVFVGFDGCVEPRNSLQIGALTRE